MVSEGLSRALWWVVGAAGTGCVRHGAALTSAHGDPTAPVASAWAWSLTQCLALQVQEQAHTH